MSKFLAGSPSDRLSRALCDAGVIKDDLSDIYRIVIDLKAGEPAKLYVALFADTSSIDVLLDAGIELAEVFSSEEQSA
jgi:hypothetical protein